MKKSLNGAFLVLSLVSALHSGVAPAFADEGGFVPVPPGRGGGGNGGNRPGPRPSASPTATPTATPTASPTPVAVDTTQARREGNNDGYPAGMQEGRERGSVDGRREGEQQGYRDGFDRCQREEAQRAFDRGFNDGYRDGSSDGANDGYRKGVYDGEARGIADGRADGQRRADNDSRRDSHGPGTARGIEQANSSDATARGNADGTVAGDRQARQRAIEVDYARGRQDYRGEREAENVSYNDEFSNRTAAPLGTRPLFSKNADPLSKILGGAGVDLLDRDRDGRDGHGAHGGAANPDYRYLRPSRTYNTPEENQAYVTAYRDAYNQGFAAEYRNSYQSNYQGAFNHSRDRGCQEARRRDYRDYYSRGHNEGRDKGYREAYQRSYDQAHRNAYNDSFPRASDQAYRETYPGAYDRHFEEARAAAYADRVDELYSAAYESARRSKFEQMYPGYAREEYARGRKDEAQDFAERPVRFQSVVATETIENGLYEPGEAIRLRATLRNYAGGALQGKDVKFTVAALDASSAVISISEATLLKGLREKSVTAVRELLEFRMNESSVGRAARFVVRATYQGRNIGEQTVEVRSRFQVGVEFAEDLAFKDGIATPIKVRLTNQSQKATDAQLKIRLHADSQQLAIQVGDVVTGALAPGESRVVEFTVVAHTALPSVSIPLAVSVNGSTSRRIGLLDRTEQVPVVNDYRVTLINEASAATLQKAGITRAYYKVQNTGSRLLYKGLQLKVRIKGMDDASNFVVIGPNPQFLMPLEKGESAQFLVPILVKADNSGGVLELELQEDGRTVVIHDADFKRQN